MKGIFLKYRPEIDGLRALAVVPVILFHGGFELFSGGFVGVDVFFVISGYLITTILIEDIENNRFSIVNFYERRARRILPALFFVMFVCIPFSWMWMLPGQLRDFSQSLMAVGLFSSNILFWLESGYFETAAEAKPLLHTWSLAVEEQYYLLFPIFLFFAWRFGKNRVFSMIVVLAAISLGLSEWGWRNQAAANFYLAPTRAWELFAGSIAAFVVLQRGVQSNNTLSLLGLAAILFAIFAYDENTPFPSLYALVPVVGVALLVLFAGAGTLAAKLLSSRFFVALGLISYSAYLWHQPLFAFARIRLAGNPSSEFMLLLSILSIVLAIFSWRYIEKPFREKGTIFASKLALLSTVIPSFIFFMCIGFFGYINDGFEERFVRLFEGDVNHSEFQEYVDVNYVDCEPKLIADEALQWQGFLRCKQTQEGNPDWVLLGDSHAEHLFLGLAESFPSTNIVYYIFAGKPYLSNDRFRSIFDVLLSADTPQKVFLTMHYVSRLERTDDLLAGFEETIEALQSAGHEVILVGDVPQYDTHPEDCLFAKNALAAQNQCSIGINDAMQQASVYHDTLTKLSADFSVDYYSISEPLCTENQCRMVQGATILYRDKDHLNIPGSILVGKHLANLMTQ
ncbi:MAG: peptidoglycan/LPS O-acetylase OafA/YrhL [Pseudohongiellaceae bacterium]|jgi:peptidoglycan/LPS O-acetylase OafA/YrhL